MILVVGATGILGTEVCRQLRQAGKPVRAFVRHGSPREPALRDLGVTIVNGDLASRVALEEACQDVSTIISTATAMASTEKGNSLRAVDRDGQLHLVEVAKAKGVGHFIFVSLSPNLKETASLVRYKREVARAIRVSGMRWTILQPSVFMEIWLSKMLGWDFEQARAMIFGSGDGAVSYISLNDVARYCVLAVDDRRMWNVEIPLGGPADLSPNEVVKIFEQVSGRKYTAKKAPAPLLALLSPVVAMIDDRKGSGMSLGAQCSRGDSVTSAIQKELGLKLTSVREYAERVIATLPRTK